MVRCPTFTLVEANKEAHESEVPSTQCRRVSRARRREPTFVFGPAGRSDDARNWASVEELCGSRRAPTRGAPTVEVQGEWDGRDPGHPSGAISQ